MQKLFCNYNEQNAIVFIFCSFICMSQQYTTNNTSVNTLVRISHQSISADYWRNSIFRKQKFYILCSQSSEHCKYINLNQLIKKKKTERKFKIILLQKVHEAPSNVLEELIHYVLIHWQKVSTYSHRLILVSSLHYVRGFFF